MVSPVSPQYRIVAASRIARRRREIGRICNCVILTWSLAATRELRKQARGRAETWCQRLPRRAWVCGACVNDNWMQLNPLAPSGPSALTVACGHASVICSPISAGSWVRLLHQGIRLLSGPRGGRPLLWARRPFRSSAPPAATSSRYTWPTCPAPLRTRPLLSVAGALGWGRLGPPIPCLATWTERLQVPLL